MARNRPSDHRNQNLGVVLDRLTTAPPLGSRRRVRLSRSLLFEQHSDRFVREYDERFERAHGPLRPIVQRVVEQYLDCGRLHGGFARLRYPSCRGEHLLAFSGQTRNFCPSCQTKHVALFAERLADEILAPVPHRHVVFTVAKVLRGLFERERHLLSIPPRCVQSFLREVVDDPHARVGAIASTQTFGSYGTNFHPLGHALVTEGAFRPAEDDPTSFESAPGGTCSP